MLLRTSAARRKVVTLVAVATETKTSSSKQITGCWIVIVFVIVVRFVLYARLPVLVLKERTSCGARPKARLEALAKNTMVALNARQEERPTA